MKKMIKKERIGRDRKKIMGKRLKSERTFRKDEEELPA